MGTKRKRKQKTTGTESSENTQTPSPLGVGTTPIPTPYPQPAISDQVRDQLTATMQELLLKTHELSFEYSTLDCKDIHKCPLANKCRELFKTVKKMHNLLKQIQPPSNKGYIS